MKIENSDGTITQSNLGNTRTVKAGISQSAMKHITSLLTRLYNDPESAVFREYVANAFDAHTKVGQTDPVEIFLPTNVQPVFTVTDCGVGMSLDVLEKVFSQYGESLKADSDEEIGGFGLGSKSALAITSQFTIISTFDGYTTHAIYSNSDDGQPELDIISHEFTDKPSGTSIAIPIQNVSLFNSKARKFMKFFPAGSFKVAGESHVQHYMEEFSSHLSSSNTVGETTFNVFNSSSYASLEKGVYMVMGGIVYTIPESDIRNNVQIEEGMEDSLNLLLSNAVVIESPIGSVKLSPNREGIQFTRNTRQYFNDIFNAVLIKFLEDASSKITDAETYLEASKAYRDMPKVQRELVPNNWGGLRLYASEYLFFPDYVLGAQLEYKGYSDYSATSFKAKGFPLEEKGLVFVTGERNERSFMSYASAYLKSESDASTLYYVGKEFLIGHTRNHVERMTKDADGNSVPDPLYLSDQDLSVIFPNGLKIIDFEEYRTVANAWKKANKAPVPKKYQTAVEKHYVTFSQNKDFSHYKALQDWELESVEAIYYVKNTETSGDIAKEVFYSTQTRNSRGILPGMAESLVDLFGVNSLVVLLPGENVKILERGLKAVGFDGELLEANPEKVIKKVSTKTKSTMNDILGYVVYQNSSILSKIFKADIAEEIKDPVLKKALDKNRIEKVEKDLQLLTYFPEYSKDPIYSKVKKSIAELKNLSDYKISKLIDSDVLNNINSSLSTKYRLIENLRVEHYPEYSLAQHMLKYINDTHRSDKTPAFTLK